MKLETVQSVVATALAAMIGIWSCLATIAPPVVAAPPSIGTAIAKGSFRVDNATVAGNATLFEGVTVETRQSSSSLDLTSGPHLLLGADSKGQIFGDRLILQRGTGEVRDGAGFRVEARGLTVRTDAGHAVARIQLVEAKAVQVAALAGGARVLNGRGLLIAELTPGMALAFEPQGAASEPEKFTGCLRTAGGHYLVTDDLTNVTVEVGGPGVERESGNQVQITGIMDPTGAPVSGATQYVRVTGLKHLAKGCPANKAAAAGAGGAPNPGGQAANSGGLSGTTVAIIGGVAAAAATVGGLAAAGSLSSGSSKASVSR